MLIDAQVTPERAFFAGRPVRIAYASDGVDDLRISIVRRRTRLPMRTYVRLGTASPGRLEWRGLTADGRVAPNGRYAVRVDGELIASAAFGEPWAACRRLVSQVDQALFARKGRAARPWCGSRR